ncbi:guanine nucleotide exchange factor MUK1 Ecym_1169 [Eremothecium cymbalariae DBVPG|uniref:VPS9 domain-containing protein n=1 Tax=Eremothecium cymbalariae (strain CBS 270.75 / DBVPG 7215 / KCTC 17166 / NRRL Y-17582) TaxID=931890 RepID=G8JMV5_ERECY|nr:hypothetical protein Ecym_1169 [Eremothecium cymbalariae DBVPG\
MFHTTAIGHNIYETEESAKGQEQPGVVLDDSSSSTSIISKQSSGVSGNSNKEELERELSQISSLPNELTKLVDIFISDLKQPKYLKPLSIFLLSGLFQQFYNKFDAACSQYVNRQSSNGVLNASTSALDNLGFGTARETLSTGLSGILNRSRSGSGPYHKKRSSSLFGTDSQNNSQSVLNPEEIQRHLRIQETNTLKIDRYLDICERDIFQKILEVGTSVPGSSQTSVQNRKAQVLDLFRNSPEFMEYDTILTLKIQHLKELAESGKLDLPEFLGMSRNLDIDSQSLGEHLKTLVEDRMSPVEKMAQLLQIHEKMTRLKDASSNDDYLSLLLYDIILNPVKMLYLNIQFIKLFRFNKKLVANEQYALTNMTAAMYFLENLTINDLPDTVKKHASPDFIFVLSERIKLPDIDSEDKPELPRTNSYKFMMGSTLDNSLRNIFGKIKSYTPPTPNHTVALNSGSHNQQYPEHTASQLSNQSQIQQIQNHRPQTQLHNDVPSRNNSQSSLKVEEIVKSRIIIPESWKRFKGREFKDLKVSELRMVFDTYQKLLRTLES